METMLGKIVAMIVTVPAEWLATLVDLLERLVGRDGDEWMKQLRFYLRKEPTWVKYEAATKVARKTLKVWKVITAGGMKVNDLITAIKLKDGDRSRNEVSDSAYDLMSKPAFEIQATLSRVDLVSLSLSELGFTTDTRTDAFMTKRFCAEWSAKNLDGYVIELCEPDYGAQLYLQCDKDQLKDKIYIVAMERIKGSDFDPHVFIVGGYGGGLSYACLGIDWAARRRIWNYNRNKVESFVFRLRRLESSDSDYYAMYI